MLEGLAFACAQYNTFLKGAGETKKSIIITTGVHLAPLQVREVRRILSGDDIHLEALDEGKRVVYLELPDTNATFGFLASVFYQCLFETLVRKADHADGGRLGRDVHCLLDEFANIGKIPNFVRLVATIRSRGISCSIILQTVSQGKRPQTPHPRRTRPPRHQPMHLPATRHTALPQPQTDGLGRRTIHMRTVGKCINESNLIGYPLNSS